MMRTVSVLIGALLGLSVIAGSAIAEQNAAERKLIGTWTLVSMNNTNAAGEKVEPFGPNPLGAYMFDASGHVIQVIAPSKEGVSSSVVATYGKRNVVDEGKILVVHILTRAPNT